ncbi:thioredoxin family protein [Tepidiforma flava]|uniref:Thioredoxin family protein n=1 Tax=Tepidiforma flava TaxID=3004094 RepID=A0ABY7MA28_9CHLR|nr:thioredoxin family protein [Tepidiforma flava]WBL37355.1 thioredoxin family protein [Tepidiforma flava]
MTAAPRRKRAWWNPGWSPKVWLIILAMVFPTVGFTAWVGLAARGESTVDPQLTEIARANAGSDILVVRGPAHTAYHALAPLPTPAQPQPAGLPTLVFFSSPACTACERMQFVHRVMEEFRGRIVFVEKSVDRDTSAERYGVRETPTFVLIDAEGRELTRFGALPDAAAFRAKVTELLEGMRGG